MNHELTRGRFAPWITLLLCGLLIIGAVVLASRYEPPVSVANFDECRDAGGVIMESYPEQCLLNGKTYTNELQRPSDPPLAESFIGMKEDEALLRAAKSNVPARVVERDEEELPTTMDFVYGRYNFYVQNGYVYKVEVEGESLDEMPPAE